MFREGKKARKETNLSDLGRSCQGKTEG